MGGMYQEFLLVLHDMRIRRMFALAVAAAICLAGWAGVWFVPNRYQAEARIFVQVDNLLPDKIGVSIASRQRQISQLKRTLTSTVTIERLIRDPDVAVFMPKDQRPIDVIIDLRRTIEVVEQQENLFRISARIGFRHLSDKQNAQLARLIVQKLIDIFVADNVQGGRIETDTSLRFLDQQIVDLQAKMRAASTRRAQYELSMFGRMSGSGTVEQQVAEARRELVDVESDLLAAQMALLSADKQLSNGPVPAAGQQGVLSATGRLNQLLVQFNDGRARGLTDNHPDMVLLRRQIARTRAEIGPGVRLASPRALQSVAADQQALVANLTQRRSQLRQQIQTVTRTLASNPDVASEQQRMMEDYAVLQEQYVTLVQKRENLRLQGQLYSATDSISFRIIDPPGLPRWPVLPDRSVLMMVVTILAVGVGPIAAFAQSRMLQRFATPQQLMRLTRLPILAGVPEVETQGTRAMQKRVDRRFWLGCFGLSLILIGLICFDFANRGVFA
jgi:polysaccharide chain length determinant protein (PEP-CTERM system associated)